MSPVKNQTSFSVMFPTNDFGPAFQSDQFNNNVAKSKFPQDKKLIGMFGCVFTWPTLLFSMVVRFRIIDLYNPEDEKTRGYLFLQQIDQDDKPLPCFATAGLNSILAILFPDV